MRVTVLVEFPSGTHNAPTHNADSYRLKKRKQLSVLLLQLLCILTCHKHAALVK